MASFSEGKDGAITFHCDSGHWLPFHNPFCFSFTIEWNVNFRRRFLPKSWPDDEISMVALDRLSLRREKSFRWMTNERIARLNGLEKRTEESGKERRESHPSTSTWSRGQSDPMRWRKDLRGNPTREARTRRIVIIAAGGCEEGDGRLTWRKCSWWDTCVTAEDARWKPRDVQRTIPSLHTSVDQSALFILKAECRPVKARWRRLHSFHLLSFFFVSQLWDRTGKSAFLTVVIRIDFRWTSTKETSRDCVYSTQRKTTTTKNRRTLFNDNSTESVQLPRKRQRSQEHRIDWLEDRRESRKEHQWRNWRRCHCDYLISLDTDWMLHSTVLTMAKFFA